MNVQMMRAIAAPLTVTNSIPAVTVAVETRDAAIARIICTFMAYLPSRDPRRDVLPRAGVRVGSEFDLAANAASMDRHRFPRDSGAHPADFARQSAGTRHHRDC